jgi:hypothetical protein
MTEQLILRFLENFSIIPIGENKIPIIKWADYQKNKITVDVCLYSFKSNRTKGWGIVTGFEDLEVIDVDLKVFSTPHEMNEFWNEYIQTLRDSIYDFDSKFVVYKTKSGGYHILYKSKRVIGNTKIASLKGHKEAIIESRGNGGYVFIYPENKVSKNSYFEVEYITDKDREILWNISKAYNYIKPIEERVKTDTKKTFSDGKTPWEDFNQQTDILDIVVPDDFEVPPKGYKRDYTLIKRYGSDSAHSGYIYNDTGCMYLFSTGTIYPHETLISPFMAYTIKHHNGDYSASAKELYQKGYGDRIKVQELKPIIEKPIIINTEFPLDIFPEEIQYYIKECSDKLQMNIDYMGCTLLWVISVIMGNGYEIEVKKGWKEKSVLWLSLVGQAGVGKTPSIDQIIFPLHKINNKEIKKYIEERKKYDEFQSLTKKEKKDIYGESYEVEKPIKNQFIVNDITLEALVDMHQENDNSLGVFKDELAGWLKDMNRYRAGSDLEFWLSTWSGKSVNVNRMTRAGSFVDKPFIPVLGGIQPTIFNNLSTEENKENGFMDRLLISFPDVKIEYYAEQELDYDAIRWYDELITKFYWSVKNTISRVDGIIQSRVLTMDLDAKKEWIRIFNNISKNQNDDEENQYLKSMYPKQKSYIPRFALLLHVFNCFYNNWDGISVVKKESILSAEKLSNYFINNAKKVKIDSSETMEIKNTMSNLKTPYDKVKAIWLQDPEFNRSKVADLLGLSRMTIHRFIEKYEQSKETN